MACKDSGQAPSSANYLQVGYYPCFGRLVPGRNESGPGGLSDKYGDRNPNEFTNTRALGVGDLGIDARTRCNPRSSPVRGKKSKHLRNN